MVAFRHADLTDAGQDEGVRRRRAAARRRSFRPCQDALREREQREVFLNGAGSHRRRLSAIGDGVTRWVNCYPGDTTTHKLSIGIGATSATTRCTTT